MLCPTAAPRIGNDLTIAYAKNVPHEIFSKVDPYFESKNASVLLQQGDLGVMHPWYCILARFTFRSKRNTIDSGALFVGPHTERL
jgi:hypothetical protein